MSSANVANLRDYLMFTHSNIFVPTTTNFRSHTCCKSKRVYSIVATARRTTTTVNQWNIACVKAYLRTNISQVMRGTKKLAEIHTNTHVNIKSNCIQENYMHMHARGCKAKFKNNFAVCITLLCCWALVKLWLDQIKWNIYLDVLLLSLTVQKATLALWFAHLIVTCSTRLNFIPANVHYFVSDMCTLNFSIRFIIWFYMPSIILWRVY